MKRHWPNFIPPSSRDKLGKYVAVVLAGAALITLVASAGSLTPSASPAGTMKTLQEIYDSIAGTFDSSGISGSQTGSLIQGLKYLNGNLGWASGSNNIWSLNSGNVGIGSTSPAAKLDVAGDAAIHSTSRLGLNSSTTTTQTSMTTYGVFGAAYQGHTSGTISNVTGVEGDAYNTAGGNVTRLIGTAGYAEQSGAGTIANMASLWAFANLRSAGTVTNNYGLYIANQTAGSSNWGLYASGSNNNYFAGNVGIGTDAPATIFDIDVNTPTDANIEYLTRHSADTTGAYIGLRKSRGTQSSMADVQNADGIGGITFNARTGSVWRQTASIEAIVDGTFTSGQRPPSAMQFFTNIANTASVERMRISSNGLFGIGTTTPKSRFSLVDAGIGSTSSGSFAIRSSNTLGSVASISATSLAGGSVFNITVPASSSANNAHGLMLVQNTAGTTIASWSMGGALAIAGKIFSDGANSSCTGVNIGGSGCIDYAESFPSSDSSLEAGEVVTIDPYNSSYVIRASEGLTPIGIVSTNPAALITGTGLLSGSSTHEAPPGTVPVALAGRVPVKFSDESGAIVPGDHLTASATRPGYAMKQTEAGMSVGIALESSGEQPTILVFVGTSYWAPSFAAATEGTASMSGNDASWFDRIIAYLKDAVLAVRELVAPRVSTDELQMRDAATGQTWCVRIVNGEFQKTPEECGASQGTTSGQEVSSPTPASNPAPAESPAPEPAAPTEPPLSETPAPEPAPSP